MVEKLNFPSREPAHNTCSETTGQLHETPTFFITPFTIAWDQGTCSPCLLLLSDPDLTGFWMTGIGSLDSFEQFHGNRDRGKSTRQWIYSFVCTPCGNETYMEVFLYCHQLHTT